MDLSDSFLLDKADFCSSNICTEDAICEVGSNCSTIPMKNNFFLSEDDSNLNLDFEQDKLEEPDFKWSDLMPHIVSPVHLDEIQPTFFYSECGFEEINKLECKSIPKVMNTTTNLLKNETPKVYKINENLNLDLARNYRLMKKPETKTKEKYCELGNSNFRYQGVTNYTCDLKVFEQRGFLNNEDLINNRPGQPVILSLEESRLLLKMGYSFPETFPLNENDEKALRTVRRKIRNKMSAQASRFKRQNYILNLEKRYELCSQENHRLRDKIIRLQNDKKEILRRFRSCMNYWSNKYAGSKSKLDDFASDDIGGNSILPLYTNKSGKRLKNENISRTATITTKAGRTSLFVMTFVILIWTMMVPLPKLSLLGYGKPIINETDFKQANLRVFPASRRERIGRGDLTDKGQSRSLLANNYDDAVSGLDELNADASHNDSQSDLILINSMQIKGEEPIESNSNLEADLSQLVISNIPLKAK